jgi:hypothetical protein
MTVTPLRPPGPRPPLQVADALAAAHGAMARAAILVEGWSDQAALEALAARQGIDLRAEAVVVVPIGGVTNLLAFALALGPAGLGLQLAGLYDRAEEAQALGQLARSGSDAAGFFRCDADLEDELIRALGPDRVEQVIEQEGELPSWQRFREQPDQRGRESASALRRFMGTRAGRKVRYGRLLVEALSPGDVPPPLRRVLAHALRTSR